MNKNMTSKTIAYSSVGAALCTLLVIIAVYVPAAGVIAAALSGVPLMYLCHKCGKVSAVSAVAVAFVVTFVLTGNILSVLVLFFTYTLPGLAFGICSAQKNRFSICIVVMSAVTLLGTLAEIMLSGGGESIKLMINEYIDGIYNAAATSSELKLNDIDADILRVLKQVLEASKETVMLYLPSIIILVSALYSYITASIGAFVLKRLGIKEMSYLKPCEIRVKKSLCYAECIVGIISLLAGGEGVSGSALNNMFLVLECIIGVCGFACVDRKFAKVLKYGYVRALIYIGVMFASFALFPVVLNVLVLIGFFDGLFSRESISPRR